MMMSRKNARKQCWPGMGCVTAIIGCLLAAPMPVTADDAPTSRDVKDAKVALPAADDLIAKHIEAIGGEDAIRAIKHIKMNGRMEVVGMGMAGPATIHISAPNHSYTEIEIAGYGKIRQGFDGTHAWVIDPASGPMLLEDGALEQSKRDSRLHLLLEMEKWYPTRETIEATEFENEPVYAVKLVTEQGTESTHYYHRETGLQIGSVGMTETPMGAMRTTTVFRDYREVSGMKMPHTLTTRVMGMEQRITIESISTEEIEREKYQAPQQIQALIEDKKAREEQEKNDEQ